jgi:hypothetical protein
MPWRVAAEKNVGPRRDYESIAPTTELRAPRTRNILHGNDLERTQVPPIQRVRWAGECLGSFYTARPVLKRRQNITAHVRAQEDAALLDFRIIEVVAMQLGDGHLAFADADGRRVRTAGGCDPYGVARAEVG